jgi:hypothetical protein
VRRTLFGAFEIRQLTVDPCTDITHLFLDVLPAQSQLRDDVLGYMTGMVGLPVGMVAFEDAGSDRWGQSFPCRRTSHTNALRPVMARPTIRVFISRVPSYE